MFFKLVYLYKKKEYVLISFRGGSGQGGGDVDCFEGCRNQDYLISNIFHTSIYIFPSFFFFIIIIFTKVLSNKILDCNTLYNSLRTKI